MATPDDLDKELKKITQSTGSVSGGGLDTKRGRASWQIRTRRDIASIIYQLNTVYYNIVKTLTDGKDAGRENVLEVGIAGTNIICYQDATQGSAFWADLLEKPATIKEVFDSVLSKISDIENQINETSGTTTYDDSSLTARLDCIELNLLQIMKDTLGTGSYGCDGSNDFVHSLASLINAIGANFSGFTPIHSAHAGETAVSSLTLSILSSGITWDVAVSQTNVADLTTHLTCIRDAIGMSGASDCTNTFSTETPSAATGGNNFIADGDSLREAIKALDTAIPTSGGGGWPTSTGVDYAGTDYEAASVAATNGYVAIVPGGTGGIQATISDGTIAGGNSRGAYCVDLQFSRIAADQVASGIYSTLVGGLNNKVPGSFSTVIGGAGNVAGSTYTSTVIGGNSNQATAPLTSMLGGKDGIADHWNEFVHSKNANSQYSRLVLDTSTTDATPTPLYNAFYSSGWPTATAYERTLGLLDDTAYRFRIDAVAWEESTGDTAWWEISGCIKRGTGVGSTTLVGSTYVTTDSDAGASGWQLNVTADTTDGVLRLEAVGEAAHTIRWSATIHSTKVNG